MPPHDPRVENDGLGRGSVAALQPSTNGASVEGHHRTARQPGPAPRAGGLGDSFSALRFRNYRLLWTGNLISNTGDWMDQVAFNWLVYQLTDSAIYLGLVNLCRWIPIMIFTPIGGVIADRVERRRLLFVTQTVAMLLAFLLAALVATNLVHISVVLLIAAGRGVMLSFNQPARQSLISDLVPPQELRKAIALNAAQFNLTRVIGPAIGGALIATVGVAGAFFVNGLSFLAVLVGLAMMRFPARSTRAKAGMLTELVGGVQYMRQRPVLGMLVLLALLPIVFGMPYMTMLTIFARDVLQVGGNGLGLLTACSSVGALMGALAVGWIGSHSSRGAVMLQALVGFGAALIVFALSPWLWLSILALLVVGFSQQLYLTTNNTIVQETVEEAYRGRILSMLFLNRGMLPLGTMLAGFGSAALGVRPTIAAMATTLVLMAVLAARLTPLLEEIP